MDAQQTITFEEVWRLIAHMKREDRERLMKELAGDAGDKAEALRRLRAAWQKASQGQPAALDDLVSVIREARDA